MNIVQSQFLEAVAQHVGIVPTRAPARPERFCAKLRHWCPEEGGTGTGRQWRCASCTEHRRLALASKRAAS